MHETYWPALKERLVHESPADIHLDCSICLDKMTILQHQNKHDESVFSLHHGAYVLACGHIFGLKCIQLWKLSQETTGVERLTCPSCRSELRIHSGCGHGPLGMGVPSTDQERHLTQQALEGWEGGWVSPLCITCTASAIVVDMSRDLQNRYMEQSLPEGIVVGMVATIRSLDYFLRETQDGIPLDVVGELELSPYLDAYFKARKIIMCSGPQTLYWYGLCLDDIEISYRRYKKRTAGPEVPREAQAVLKVREAWAWVRREAV
ncbi:hypothetical protein FZEAL_6389 [Fusarium zealandicum]|uniref:RING-type domain-containing protein n=1 Tax=Fusarium zealandicum TaxID=1053134 RepID=A0A8H4XIX6_9HYPO|nr:hypothetical protein FZEAL_6389 [Fusarium zealandicum]